MSDKLAFCGIDCGRCPIHIATVEDDDEKREQIAREWTTEEVILKPENINCAGCRAEKGPLISYCMECKVRERASSRGYDNCAYCDEYICEKLQEIYNMWPEIQERLDEIRKLL